jgi:8-oxo-dGTP pyrophosphatase MutT (NUDIX family)
MTHAANADEPTWATLSASLGRLPTEADDGSTPDAAVTIVFRREGPAVLLMERELRDGDPASGQVSLPGGHREPADRAPSATALRELAEEVGLRERDVELPPRYLGTYRANRFGVDVAVFAIRLARGAGAARAADPREVRRVFWLPCDRLEPPVRVPRETGQGMIEVEATLFDGAVVWGFTRRILIEALTRLVPKSRAGRSASAGSIGGPSSGAQRFKKAP